MGVGLVVGYSDDEGDIVGLLLLWAVVVAAASRRPVSIRRKLTFDGAKPSPVPVPPRRASPRALAEPKEASESKEASSEELNPKLPPPPPRLK